MYIDKNKVLSSLTKEDIINICKQLGCPDYKKDNNGNLCFNTALCHGGGGGGTGTEHCPGVEARPGGRRYPEAAKNQTGHWAQSPPASVCPSLTAPWEGRGPEGK